jgi:pimeloyl-ACP methyl ester carboxylesterase
MTQVKSSSVTVAGHPCRVLEAGAGSPVVYLAGIGGLPKWSPFLDALSTTRRVIAPSLPGFPGAPDFRHLDDYHEWVVATLELLEALGDAPVDLVATSVAGPLAAEVAGIAPERVRRLVLIAPFGMYDDADPTTDIWAQRPGPDVLPALLCNAPENWTRLWEMPAGEDAVEWGINLTRAMEAAARFLFPMGNTGVAKRLYRVRQPTLLVNGANDRVIPASYQQRFATRLGGPVVRHTVAAAGHLVDFDQPAELARQINVFLVDQRY